MPKTHPPYPEAFRADAIALVKRTGSRSLRSRPISACPVRCCGSGCSKHGSMPVKGHRAR